LRIRLLHFHLPKLDRTGFLTYGGEAAVVRATQGAERVPMAVATTDELSAGVDSRVDE
jgi:hypothetical protein